MPVYEKIDGYTLNAPFVAGGGIYTAADAARLIMWARFKSTPIDEKSSLTLTYDAGSGSPASLLNLPIPNRAVSRVEDLPVARFDSSSASLKIAANTTLQFGAPVPGASTDKPFTLATWIKVDQAGAGAGQPIFTMTGASGTQFAIYIQYVIYSDNEAKIQVSLQDTVNGGIRVVGFNWKHPTQIDEILSPNWQHIAFTFSGKISDPDYGFKVYSNGKRLLSTAQTATGTYVGMAINTANNVSRVGSHLGGTPSSSASFSEFCAWGSDLSHSAIKALYSMTAGRYTAKSGIISLPNRVRLREVDSLTGSYAPYARTTGAWGTKKGTGPSTFNDGLIQIFKNPGGTADEPVITFPLVNTEEQIELQDVKNLIATPNQNSSLKVYWQPTNDSSPATKGPTPAVSTMGTRKIVNYGMDFEPFDEARLLLGPKDNAFYASGTTRSTYPGYSSPLRDKIAISIPINNSAEKYITRYSNRDLYIDKEGLFPTEGFHNTGFSYYNFSDKKWEDKGLYDDTCMFYRSDWLVPTWAGSPFVSTPSFSPIGLGTKIGKNTGNWGGRWATMTQGGSWPKMQQFKMSDHMGVVVDSPADPTMASVTMDPYGILTASLMYDKIGAATSAGLAPWHERYHATGSQVAAMNQWLTEDFLLEKAVIEIPVIVQRMRGGRASIGNQAIVELSGAPPGGTPSIPSSTTAQPTGMGRFYGSCRDIDNYTFFLYRQRRNNQAVIDSPNDVTGSTRELIASGCASFYNSRAFSGRVPSLVSERGLPHGPSFSHDFNIASGCLHTDNPTDIIASFTGTIRIEMEAAIANSQFLGASRFPVLGISSSTPSRPAEPLWFGYTSVATQDFWNGGVTMPSASVEANSGYTLFGPINGMGKVPGNFFTGGANFSLAAGLAPYASRGSLNSFIQLGEINTAGNPQISTSPRSLIDNPGFGQRYLGPDLVSATYNLSGSGGMVIDESKAGVLGYTNGGFAYPIFTGARPVSQISPYLLKPEDELVLGIDAGISMIPSSGTLNWAMGGLNNFGMGVDAGVHLGMAQSSASHLNSVGLGPAGGEIFGEMSGSFMKILQGDAKITLFGSQVRKNKEVLFETNQNLTSDAIHEAIGDDRVLDQFDIASRMDLSGTYVDRLFAGTMNIPRVDSGPHKGAITSSINVANGFTNEGNGFNYVGTSFIFGNTGNIRRCVGLFSRNWTSLGSQDLSAGKAVRTGTLPSPNIFSPNSLRSIGTPPRSWPSSTTGVGSAYQTNGSILNDRFNVSNMRTSILGDGSNNKSNVALQRFITIPSMGKTYYDSMAPDIGHYCDRQSNPAHEQFYALKTRNVWPPVFPILGGGPAPEKPTNLTPQWQVWAYPPVSGVFPYPYEGNPGRHLDQRVFIRALSTVQGTPAAANIMFEAGPVFGGRTARMVLFSRGINFTFYHQGAKVVASILGHVTGANGPRFGMISPVNKNPTAVFRRDRYGQYRDMLEQQPDTKYYNTLETLAVAGKDSRYLAVRSELPGIQDSPVQVRFVDIENGSVIVNPYSTNSTNFSNEYTASIPFGDHGGGTPRLIRFIPLDTTVWYEFGSGTPFMGFGGTGGHSGP